ncbi:hypothetical protein BJ170DRAFT_279248 [Xylariales sp. AK1849]|nr:hypothetical protein BJ170DRAFT_279248 [Xylariales sp. AK1849]
MMTPAHPDMYLALQKHHPEISHVRQIERDWSSFLHFARKADELIVQDPPKSDELTRDAMYSGNTTNKAPANIEKRLRNRLKQLFQKTYSRDSPRVSGLLPEVSAMPTRQKTIQEQKEDNIREWLDIADRILYHIRRATRMGLNFDISEAGLVATYSRYDVMLRSPQLILAWQEVIRQLRAKDSDTNEELLARFSSLMWVVGWMSLYLMFVEQPHGLEYVASHYIFPFKLDEPREITIV